MLTMLAALIYSGAILIHARPLRWTAALLVGPDQVRRWDAGEKIDDS